LFLEAHATLIDDRGRRRIVRNGHLPERLIQTGIDASGPWRFTSTWAER
jgi:hypothetical protein